MTNNPITALAVICGAIALLAGIGTLVGLLIDDIIERRRKGPRRG